MPSSPYLARVLEIIFIAESSQISILALFSTKRPLDFNSYKRYVYRHNLNLDCTQSLISFHFASMLSHLYILTY